MAITFFFNNGGSGQIRGKQIGEYLGARLNPADDFEEDLCIWVKKEPPEKYPKYSYLDMLDGNHRLPWIKRHPDIPIIAASTTQYEFLKALIPNKIVLIPQHHCNFERIVSQGTRYGVVGCNGAIEDEADKLFGDFYWYKNFQNREDVVEAYKKLGTQIIWRRNNLPWKNPLKIVNAMSFGIPTIAYPEIGYKEVEGYYTQAETVEQLKQIPIYDKQQLINKAEEYHIDNISKLYYKL